MKLQMTDRPVCSGYVAVCTDYKTLALPQALLLVMGKWSLCWYGQMVIVLVCSLICCTLCFSCVCIAGDSSRHGRKHHLACGRAEGQIRRDCAGRCVCVCVCVCVRACMCMAFHNALGVHTSFTSFTGAYLSLLSAPVRCTYVHGWLCPSLPPSLPLPSDAFSAPSTDYPPFSLPLCQLLKNQRVNPNATNEHGNTPLHYACFFNYRKIAEVHNMPLAVACWMCALKCSVHMYVQA